MQISKQELIRMAKLEKARRDFWYYCKLSYPQFYRDDMEYLKDLCNSLQEFYYNDDEFMIINLPPRHAKSFTASNFVTWILGRNPLEKIMTGSYNEDLSKVFSKTIRNIISTEKVGDNIVYSDIFPKTKIKYGSAEVKKWQTEASNQINYLATSPSGTATGFGATIEIIDDLIKNALESNNQTVLENHWDWFTNTMLSRREGKRKVIIIMTRWNSNDLAGKVLKYAKENNIKYTHINYKVYNEETDSMLCDRIFDKNAYKNAIKLMGADIFSANYQQEPLDLKGALYNNLKTYDNLPTNIRGIYNYTDTADTGADYLASANYIVTTDNKAYILDVLFTKKSMEITEPLLAEMLLKDKVNYCMVESNNGGRGFSRNVERLTREKGNRITIFQPFTQTKNKQSRILTNSTNVINNIYFPSDWSIKWREFYNSVTTYQREGKNKHDDSVDMLTGIVEKLDNSNSWGW